MDPSARDDASSYGATAESGRASDAALRTRGRAHLAKSTVVAALLTLAALAAALVALGGPARPLALGRRHRAATAADASFSALLVSNASSAPAELTVSRTHIKDNRPLYYIAPAGANAGKVSMVCLSPKVWSTSMGMLLLAGHRPEEVRASPLNFNGVAKAHDSLTVPSASVSGTKAGNESGESVDGLTRDDRYFITRDPLDRLYSGYRAKIACVDLHPQTECECGNVLKYLPSVFWKPKRDEKAGGGEAATSSERNAAWLEAQIRQMDFGSELSDADVREIAADVLESGEFEAELAVDDDASSLDGALAWLTRDWEARNLCAEPSFEKFVGWLELALSTPGFTKRRIQALGTSWFNHFVPQTWLGCGFDVARDLTVLRTEEPERWYPGFIDKLGLAEAHRLDGKTWGSVPGGQAPRECYFRCEPLTCDEMVGGTCPSRAEAEPGRAAASRKYGEAFDATTKARACDMFADDLEMLGYDCDAGAATTSADAAARAR